MKRCGSVISLFYNWVVLCFLLWLTRVLLLICIFIGLSPRGTWWETATSSLLDWSTVCSLSFSSPSYTCVSTNKYLNFFVNSTIPFSTGLWPFLMPWTIKSFPVYIIAGVFIKKKLVILLVSFDHVTHFKVKIKLKENYFCLSGIAFLWWDSLYLVHEERHEILTSGTGQQAMTFSCWRFW